MLDFLTLGGEMIDNWKLCVVNYELSRLFIKRKSELEIQGIIHLHNVANQLSDECTDSII